MGCDCCKIDTPQIYEKCEKLRVFAAKYHKKREYPCDLTFGVHNPNFFPKKKRKKKTK